MSWLRSRPRSAGRRRNPNNLQAERHYAVVFSIGRTGVAAPARHTSKIQAQGPFDIEKKSQFPATAFAATLPRRGRANAQRASGCGKNQERERKITG